jgi:exonuclease III
MGGSRNGVDGRISTMPVRKAEVKAIHHIIQTRFDTQSAQHNWLICGDLNDYQQRVDITGNSLKGFDFTVVHEQNSALDALLESGFC